ncbi:hypothetical protein V2S66_30390 [Streptomyces sp. V4-01]|uniref:Uncharacterized protein n=1 Tax=Actinacidiphila polyblastidii TaxID=3110430 RepID=A0ABU7PK92_9ACTN|nr:hypothetical protein [Streptomyces sp. V4-01]
MDRHMNRSRREAAEKYGPAPTNPVEALAHVIAVYADQPDDTVMVQATTGIYDDAPWTGLRLGDLRAILSVVQSALDTHRGPGRPPSELPDWAIIQLSDQGFDPGDVSHFIGDPTGRTIAAAVDGKPVHLRRD